MKNLYLLFAVLVMSVVFSTVFVEKSFAQIYPGIQGAQKIIQDRNLTKTIQGIFQMESSDLDKPNSSRWYGNDFALSLKDDFWLMTIDSNSSIMYGAIYSLSLVEYKKTRELAEFNCTTYQNGTWTYIRYVPELVNPFSVLNYRIKEPLLNDVNFIPYRVNDLLGEFGFLEGVNYDNPYTIVWIKKDFVPDQIMCHLEKISHNAGMERIILVR